MIIIKWFLHELQVQGNPGKGGWLDGGWQLGTNGPLVQLPVRHTLPSVKQASSCKIPRIHMGSKLMTTKGRFKLEAPRFDILDVADTDEHICF